MSAVQISISLNSGSDAVKKLDASSAMTRAPAITRR
uniref:2-keto-3-deoxygluconate kinase n=1 Tax=Macrostomum lignano TaxID=282301 RepID=A0A1I8FDJ7_9PLAT